mmetsp:Transcript_77559/g.179812  ORF Transcript_77559/g.179812 Transcript_77559/m.179812 type:complete len:151 (-) Transcript_77559:58-510(-)
MMLCIVAVATPVLAGAISSSRLLDEEARAFESTGALIDSEGFRAFVDTAAHGARSQHDAARQHSLDEAIATQRSFDISISDEWASRLDEQQDVVSLHELAQQQWAGAGTGRAKQQQRQPQPPLTQLLQQPQRQREAGAKGSLRSLLLSAR